MQLTAHWIYLNSKWIVRLVNKNGEVLAVNNFLNVEEGQKWAEERFCIICQKH